MKMFLLSLMILLVGCGKTNNAHVIDWSKSCKVERVSGGVEIRCNGNDPVFIADGSDGMDGLDGTDGMDGADGKSIGIDISTSMTCSNGGVLLRSFIDTNMNANLDSGEVVLKSTSVCNGVDGEDGTSVSVVAAPSSDCPNGGYLINGSLPICNGKDGTTGPQGPQGPAGLNGVGGVIPTQLCPNDSAALKEQGLVIDGELYAVYHNVNTGHTFLAKMSVGTWVTTNGSNCVFTYANNGNVITLTSGTNVITININGGGSGGGSNTTGNCSVVNQNDSSNSYLVTTTGTMLNSSGKLIIKLSSGAITGHNYSGGGATSNMSGGVYNFKPHAGVANSFLVYRSNNNASVVSAKVVDGNGNTHTCTVIN